VRGGDKICARNTLLRKWFTATGLGGVNRCKKRWWQLV